MPLPTNDQILNTIKKDPLKFGVTTNVNLTPAIFSNQSSGALPSNDAILNTMRGNPTKFGVNPTVLDSFSSTPVTETKLSTTQPTEEKKGLLNRLKEVGASFKAGLPSFVGAIKSGISVFLGEPLKEISEDRTITNYEFAVKDLEEQLKKDTTMALVNKDGVRYDSKKHGAMGFGFKPTEVKMTTEDRGNYQKQLDEAKSLVTKLKTKDASNVNVEEKLKASAHQDFLKTEQEKQQVIEKFGQPKQWSGQWLANEVATNTPQFLASFGAGIATAVITKNPQAAFAVGFSSSYIQESGAAYEQAKGVKGVNESQAQDIANNTGMINALIEQIPLGRALNKAPAGKELKKSLLKNVTTRLISGSQQGLTEGGTEAVQQIVSNAWMQTVDENQKLLEGVPESFLIGGVLGIGGDVVSQAVMGKSSDGIGNKTLIINPEAPTKAKIALENALELPKESRSPIQQEIVDNYVARRVAETTTPKKITTIIDTETTVKGLPSIFTKDATKFASAKDFALSLDGVTNENNQVGLIDPVKITPRDMSSVDRAKVESLKKSITANENVPATVISSVNGKLETTDGTHRTLAYQELAQPQPVVYHGKEIIEGLTKVSEVYSSLNKGTVTAPVKDSRPNHQKQLEEAANTRNIPEIKKILDSIPETDPYKKPMEDLFRKMTLEKTSKPTANDLVESKTKKEIQTKLEEIFGTYKQLDDIENTDPDDERLAIADKYMADIEHAAIERNTSEVQSLLTRANNALARINTTTQATQTSKIEEYIKDKVEKRTVKFREDQDFLRKGQPPIGQDFNSELTARERFDIPNLKKLSSGGSDREVFDLGNGTVLKIAKTARGLGQNMLEGEQYAPVPKSFESGKNYVVVEKVGKPDAITKQLVKDLEEAKDFNARQPAIDMVNKVANKYIESGDPLLEEIGYSVQDLNNYNIMLNDVTALRNWGTNSDGMPSLLDAGSLNTNVIEQYKGTKNLDDPDFREAYNKSREAKKKFEDTDNYTKFRIKDDVKTITGKTITNAQEQELIDLNKKIFGDEDVKITLQIMANKKALGSYSEGMIQVLDGQVAPKDTFYHEAVHKYLDTFTTKQEYIDVLTEAQNKYQIEDLNQVEERLAEDFINYAKTREETSGLKGLFDKIIQRIKAFLGSGDAIDQLYNDIISGKAVQTPEVQVALKTVNKEQIRVTKDAKGVLQTLKAIKNELNMAIIEAEGKAVFAQEIRSQLNTENIAKLKRIYSLNETFQAGDIETIRKSSSGDLLNSVIEDVQSVYPDLSEQDAFDMAMSLPTKAEETPRVANKQELVQKEKKLSEYLDQLREKQKELKIKENDILTREWEQVLTAQEKLTRIVEVPSSQMPVGTGKEKISRLEARVRGILDSATLSDKEELGLATFNQMNQDENIAMATEFVTNNPEDGMRVLKGEIQPPRGVLYNSILIAMKSLGTEDTALGLRIATYAATRAGQEISILQKLTADNPVTIMEDVMRTKIEAFEKRTGKKAEVKIKEEVKKIDADQKAPNMRQWNSFLESIRC